MIVGVKKVMCTCSRGMVRTGGSFGGDSPSTETYYCSSCAKHVIIIMPNEPEQKEFAQRVRR